MNITNSHSLNSNSNLLKRRKSLKSIKLAKINILQKTQTRKNHYIGDRIMAHRGVMNFDDIETIRNAKCVNEIGDNNDDLSVRNLINKTMHPSGKRVLKLTLHHKSPTAEEKLENLIRNTRHFKPKLNRQISIHPDRVLDAPEVSLEYPNIFDWSRENVVAVALGEAVYLWDATVRRVSELVNNNNRQGENELETVSCVKWIDGGRISPGKMCEYVIAVGTSLGSVALWDTSGERRLLHKIRVSNIHRSPVSAFHSSSFAVLAIAVRDKLLSLGLSSGIIQHRSLQSDNSLPIIDRYHKSRINHLKWSCNNESLAVVCVDSISIYSANRLKSHPSTSFPEKVNDIFWSPKDAYILLCCCSDENGTVKMLDVKNKTCLKSIVIGSSISCVYWSDVLDEIAVSAKDNEDYRIKILDENTLLLMFELIGHKGKIITMKSNPNGDTMASIGFDEQIRLWSCFQNQGVSKPKNIRNQKSSFLRDLERFR